MLLKALVFDAYGTLFDVHSVVARCEEFWPGRGTALSALWRTKQLEYTWLRSLMGRYRDFDVVTGQALGHACAALHLSCSAEQSAALMRQYRQLAPFPDALPTLQALRGRTRAILSNGSPAMLDAVVRHNDLHGELEAVLSVDALAVYKPDPRVYQLAVDRLGLQPHEIGFVSSNAWDACGAKAFGFRVFWINRNAAPVEGLELPPDHLLSSLGDLLSHL